jgi:hypothetical protein
MRTMPSTSPARHRARRPAALTALLAGAAAALLADGCAASPATTPTAAPSATGGGTPVVSSSPADTATPSAGATITAGPVPPAAAATAVRYWRLVDAHRYRALLTVVTPDSHAAAAVKAGNAAGYWGIRHVRVVSVDPAVGPLPPHGATLEISMTVDVSPAPGSPWSAGRTLVFVSLRRVGRSWRVYETGTGP